MQMKIIVTTLLLVIFGSKTSSQTIDSSEVYYAEFERQLVVGIEKTILFVILKPGSKSEIVAFSSEFNYSVVKKNQWVGTYSMINDTLLFSFILGVSNRQFARTYTGETVDKFPERKLVYQEHPFEKCRRVNQDLVVLDTTIAILKPVRISFYRLIEAKYDTWNERLPDGKVFPALQ
jgi:hypothetical protein